MCRERHQHAPSGTHAKSRSKVNNVSGSVNFKFLPLEHNGRFRALETLLLIVLPKDHAPISACLVMELKLTALARVGVVVSTAKEQVQK